jgi:hypothetical protein
MESRLYYIYMNLRSAISLTDLNRLYFDEGLTLDEIAARFSLSPTSVRRRMQELGLPARAGGPHVERGREYAWSPALAYAVGLIATDGNLSPDGRHMTVTSADRDLLETVRTCLGITTPIAATHGGHIGSLYYRLQWSNRAFYDWLLSIGLMPAKSLRLGPLAVPDEYFVDFFRGCIDGDGSIVTYTDRYNTFKSEKYVYKRLFVSLVSGSYSFLDWLYNYLGPLLDLSGGIFERHRERSTWWVLKYMKNDSVRLLRWMYYSPDVPCLARKRSIALPYLNAPD